MKTAARAYASPLRAEHMEHTRVRILQALTELVGDGSAEELTIPLVARRAHVSLRTVYRHFPTREALFDAWGDWAEENFRIRFHSYPETLADLLAMAPELYRSYDENEHLVRAMLAPGPARHVRVRTRRQRQRRFQKALEEITGSLSPAAQQRALAVVYLLNSAPAWQAMRDQWGLDGREAGQAAAWAVRALVDELRRNPDAIEGAPADSPSPQRRK